MEIKGILADVFQKRLYPAAIRMENRRIASVMELPEGTELPEGILMPGFVDAHIHIESSLLIPSEFARMAVVHGTVATVSDPHEIANVCGIEGVEYMIADGRRTPFKFFFGAPSCVPATTFETAGAALNPSAVETLLARPEIYYLSEMMNFPGLLHGDREVMEKIAAAIRQGKPVDGHAPGLRGAEAKKYIEAGVPGSVTISTDHECFTAGEALDKLQYGMKILIREGSAARNFDALIGLLEAHPDQMMFCSDDKHPDSLLLGHIDQLCARAIAAGVPVFTVLRAACVNPVEHYKLPVGLLRAGDPADLIRVTDLTSFRVMETWIDGQQLATGGKSLLLAQGDPPAVVNRFAATGIGPDALIVEKKTPAYPLPVIGALDGQLVTAKSSAAPKAEGNQWVSDPGAGVLKIVVVNRYQNAPVSKAFIENIGLRSGAIASSVAHDSHNIVAVGADDASLCRAINLVIRNRGGLVAVSAGEEKVLPLPVAGLMTTAEGYGVADSYIALDAMAKKLGSTLRAPFMTLSFMALLVIPHCKISDLGLFDGDNFRLIS